MLIKVFTVLLGLFTVGLAQDLEAINPDGLNPEASHVCSSTIKEYYTVSESYHYYVQVKTYTWCWAVPPRCAQYSNQRKEGRRQVTKSRQRKSYFCCEGYQTRDGINYCFPRCKDKCNSHGNCILPEVCGCFEGYTGTYCESNCPEGYWGENCENECQCGSYGSCDPQSGNCICHIGYTGNDCSTPCQGAFGLHCIYPCRCENNANCSNVDGHCTCKPGYYDTYCQRECSPGTTADDCKQECQCQNDGVCICQNGDCDCICRNGTMGKYCAEKCDDFHWGLNCSEDCICYSGNCDPETGKCRCDMNYGGDNCQIECKPGFYGEDCMIACACQHGGSCYYSDAIRTVSCNCSGTGYYGSSCHNRDCDETKYLVAESCQNCDCPWDTTNSCDVISGECQCKTGYKGDRCLEKCEMPFYGVNCAELCECPHGDCHHVTGECTKCYAGYIGSNCDQVCPSGYWGINCTQTCNCQNGAKCHPNTGYCNCSLGFSGLYCAQRCPVGTYGYNCKEVCECNNETAICSPTDGQCQCLSGYYGEHCHDQCPPTMYGFQCLSNCSCSKNGTTSCDHKTGECNCKAGWKGVTCNSLCYEGTWGENCLRSCDCNQHGSCDQFLGDCICYPGYIGPNCSQECPEGKYGFGCLETCQSCSDGAVCDFVTGECPPPGSCPAGFTGTLCQDLCPDGYWGDSCVNVCATTCSGDRGRCNPINGKCRCFPGYRGLDCEHECEAGKYGIACQMDCLCVAEQTASCHHKSGQCTCKPGFTGDFCDNHCGAGFWGPGCLFACRDVCNTAGATGYCNFITGVPCQCLTGYDGDHCQNQIGVSVTDQQRGGGDEAAVGISPVVIAVIAVAVVLIIIIIIIVIYYGRRVRKLKEDNLQVSFSVNGANTYDNSPVENHMQTGVVNPTYEAQNLNNENRYPHMSSRPPAPHPRPTTKDDNETRYPHLSSRCTPAPHPPLTKGDSCSDRRMSGCYDDPDEDRYTTLKSLSGASCGNDDSLRDTSDVNVQRPSNQSKVSDKFVFYTGPKVPNSAAERSRSPSSSHDQRLRRDDIFSSSMKPNNLHLAQQTTITDPSPTTSCSSLDGDTEHSNQAFEDPVSHSLAFVNEKFQSATNVKQSFNDTDNSGETHLASGGIGQTMIPNQYTPVPHTSTVSEASSSSTSSENSLNLPYDPTGQALISSSTNPYDTPKTREETADDSTQATISNGYLTPTVGLSNPYDTPRTTSLSSNPYDTPRALNHLNTDTDEMAKAELSIDMERANEAGESENWVTFEENKETSDQSIA